MKHYWTLAHLCLWPIWLLLYYIIAF